MVAVGGCLGHNNLVVQLTISDGKAMLAWKSEEFVLLAKDSTESSMVTSGSHLHAHIPGCD